MHSTKTVIGIIIACAVLFGGAFMFVQNTNTTQTPTATTPNTPSAMSLRADMEDAVSTLCQRPVVLEDFIGNFVTTVDELGITDEQGGVILDGLNVAGTDLQSLLAGMHLEDMYIPLVAGLCR